MKKSKSNNGKRTLRAIEFTLIIVVLFALMMCSSGCAGGAINADDAANRTAERLNKLEQDFNDFKTDVLREWALQDKKDEANQRAWAAADRWIFRKLEEEKKKDEANGE